MATGRARTAEQRVLDAAQRRHGTVPISDARDKGLRQRQIRRRVESGRWLQQQPKCLVVAGTPVTWQQGLAAAVASCGPEAAAGLGSALHLLGAPTLGAPSRHHVVVATGASPSRAGPLSTALATCRAEHCIIVDGIRTTDARRTTIDLAAVLPAADLLRVVDDVVGGGLASRSSVHRLGQELARGRRGVRTVLDATSPDSATAFRSTLERAAANLISSAGLPRPGWNQPVADAWGTIGTVDAVYPALRIAIEFDGLRFYRSEAQRRRDRERDRRLALAGWVVLRFDWADVLHQSDRVARDIARALAARR